MINFNANRTSEKTEQQLLDEFLGNQDIEVLGVLYERFIHIVYGLCLKYLKNREDSQDAVMQIFEVVIRDLPKAQVRSFKSWLYVVSKNHCLMQLRKQSKEKGKSVAINDEIFMESHADLHPIDEEENRENMGVALQECINKLKEEQKVCVELFYYEHKCYREISGILNIGENKVKSYIQNGKRNLRICIENTTAVNESKH